jgi:hypothetical protein
MSSPPEAFRLVLRQIPEGAVRMNKRVVLREMLWYAANRGFQEPDEDQLSCPTCADRRERAENCTCSSRNIYGCWKCGNGDGYAGYDSEESDDCNCETC